MIFKEKRYGNDSKVENNNLLQYFLFKKDFKVEQIYHTSTIR